MRHTPRAEKIRRRLAADPITVLKARRLRRSGMLQLETLGAVMSWLQAMERLSGKGMTQDALLAFAKRRSKA